MQKHWTQSSIIQNTEIRNENMYDCTCHIWHGLVLKITKKIYREKMVKKRKKKFIHFYWTDKNNIWNGQNERLNWMFLKLFLELGGFVVVVIAVIFLDVCYVFNLDFSILDFLLLIVNVLFPLVLIVI